MVLGSTSRLAETAALVLGALAFGSLVVSAALMLVARLCALVVTAAIAVHGAPWCRPGFRYARMTIVRRLAGPALAVTALPIAFAVDCPGIDFGDRGDIVARGGCGLRGDTNLDAGDLAGGRARRHGNHARGHARFRGGDSERIRRLTRINIRSILTLDVPAFTVIARSVR